MDEAVDALRSDLETQIASKAALDDVYTKAETYTRAEVYSAAQVDAALDRFDVIAARATGAGVKQTPGPYTVSRLIEGEYEFVFDVSARDVPGNGNTPVISAMARCPASVGYTSGGVIVDPGTGEIQSVTVRVLVFDSGGPLDCGVDLHLKLGNP